MYFGNYRKKYWWVVCVDKEVCSVDYIDDEFWVYNNVLVEIKIIGWRGSCRLILLCYSNCEDEDFGSEGDYVELGKLIKFGESVNGWVSCDENCSY